MQDEGGREIGHIDRKAKRTLECNVFELSLASWGGRTLYTMTIAPVVFSASVRQYVVSCFELYCGC